MRHPTITRQTILPAITALLALSGCAAALSTIRYRDLVVQSELDNSIFLTPTADLTAIYLDVRNTAGVDTPVREAIVGALQAGGCSLVEAPAAATLVVQVNVVQVTQQVLDGDEDVMDAIVQAAAAGATMGAVAGVLGAESAVDEVFVLGGVAAFALDAMNRRTAFTVLADVRITEYTGSGAGGIHEARVISGATKLNLTLEEASPHLAGEVARVVTGILLPVR